MPDSPPRDYLLLDSMVDLIDHMDRLVAAERQGQPPATIRSRHRRVKAAAEELAELLAWVEADADLPAGALEENGSPPAPPAAAQLQ